MNHVKLLGMIGLLSGVLGACNQEVPLCLSPPPENGSVAHFVSVDEAVSMARNYVRGGQEETRSADLKVGNIEIFGATPTRSEEPDDNTLWGYYVINFENNSGFALVSADSRNMPVYAFSGEGCLSLSDTTLNYGLKEYIEGLPQTVPDSTGTGWIWGGVDGQEGINPPDPGIQPSPITYTKEVAPLLYPTIRIWSQWAPFNKYCINAEGEQCVVGCGPLSMGMILSYYEYPTQYKNYTFDWSEMKRRHASDDLARLLWVLGLPENLNATYGAQATSTSVDRISPAYVNMGYEKPSYSAFLETSAVRLLKQKNHYIW